MTNQAGLATGYGYDVAGRRVAATNAWGSSVALTSLYGYDANGNQITMTNGYGSPSQTVVTNVFDALNRHRQTLFPDGTRVSTAYDAAGRRIAETNQDNLVTRYGYDGLGRLASVTNALSQVTRYEYDPTGSLLRQVDALNRTNTFGYDSMGRRISHLLPGKQAESFGYDLAGNLVRHTNCNGVVITNQFDPLNRLTNRASANGYRIGFAYSATGQRTNMTDLSGATSYGYDARDRLTNEVVTWTGGPTVTLKYRYDANGNVTNLWSSSTSGVTNVYQYDALNRLTNVLAGGGLGASYGYDTVGNLQTVRYGNAVTNLNQYDRLNRLTNAVWKLSASTLGSFYYQLGSIGNRTELSETVGGASRTYQWQYDQLYRLTNEVVSALGSAAYRYDAVGNRTNRTSTIPQLPTVNSSYNTNDWLGGDLYDNNGNTRTNASGQAYLYDAENRLTNYNGGAVVLTFEGWCKGKQVTSTDFAKSEQLAQQFVQDVMAQPKTSSIGSYLNRNMINGGRALNYSLRAGVCNEARSATAS